MLTVFLLISGWFFSSSFFLINQATLRGGFNIIPLIFLFFAPAITMRLISEEKKSGTIELLVTMPVRDSEIILGKFFAAMALLSVAVLLTFPYAIIISFLGDLDWGPVMGGYLGLILMGAAYLAIGLFASSLTENQVVAFIVALLFAFTLFMLDKVLMFVPQGLVSILEYLSIEYHFTNISRGVIDSRDIIYYLSLIIFSLLLAVRGLGSRRWR
ncbi:MAG: ABC transporter permease subunit [bacterium]